jgi:Holliday junction resolvase RusA-like endonuclease
LDVRRHAISTPVNVKAVYYMQTRRKVDLSNLNSALHDILVDAGVLADDNRDVVAGHDGSRVFYDKDTPRVEVTITPMPKYEQWVRGTKKVRQLLEED